MNSSRIWLFRGLVVVAAGLMLLSWFLPWWSASLEALQGVEVIIRPYGLSHQLGEVVLLMPAGGAEVEMPVWFTPLMWLYLGLAIVALLIGAWIKDKSIGLFGREFNLSRLIIGVAGFSYIVVAVLAVIVAAIRTGDLGMSLLGYTFVQMGWVIETGANATLRFGYWLACGVGPLLIVLALLRNRIIGRAKSISQ